MRVVLLLIACLLLGTETFAQTPSRQVAVFGDDLQSYFRHPNPQLIIDEFFALPPSDMSSPGRPYIIGAFFSRLIDKDSTVGSLLVERCRSADKAFTPTVITALNLSHHPQRVDLIRSIGGDEALKRLVPPSFDLRTLVVTQPVQLDMLWTSFFATGDGSYLERIAEVTAAYIPNDQIQALAQSVKDKPEARENVIKATIAQAAVWSLTSNATRYPEVRTALVHFVQNHQGMASAMSAAILAKTGSQ